MKVVLIDEAPGLGIAGDVCDVKDGFARNYLFPKQLAVLATPQELSRADSRRRVEVVRRTKLNLEMETVGERLAEERLLIAVRVGPGGRLYGSVTTTEIAEALNEAMGVDIDRRAINLAQPIRELGRHQTPVRLAPDVIPNVTIIVYAEGAEPPPIVEETPEEEQEEGVEAATDEMTETTEAVETAKVVEDAPVAEEPTAEDSGEETTASVVPDDGETDTPNVENEEE